MHISPNNIENKKLPEAVREEVVHECYARSLQLLKNNSTPSGIIACTMSRKAADRSYTSIFGRDAAICSLGMVASGDRELAQSAKISLLTLAQHQAANGQIPKYVKPEAKEVDFWYSGCIDATLWWLIALHFYHHFCPEEQLTEQLRTETDRALHWLFCQEHQGVFLLQQNEASDWADIMPRSGFVLYTNALWYHVKRLYKIPTDDKTRHFLKTIFFPFDKAVPEHRRVRILTHYIKNKVKRSDFYLSFVNFSFCGEEVDIFGNILSALFGLNYASRASRMVDAMIHLKIHQPYPMRTVDKPIQKNNPLWRLYMHRHKQNIPYQYHNGGIWPFIGGFWVMLLAKLGKKKLAWEEIQRLAEVNKLNNWEFNEWFHGKTGEPMGMPGQSWNAAMFILAFHALHDNVRFQDTHPNCPK